MDNSGLKSFHFWYFVLLVLVATPAPTNAVGTLMQDPHANLRAWQSCEGEAEQPEDTEPHFPTCDLRPNCSDLAYEGEDPDPETILENLDKLIECGEDNIKLGYDEAVIVIGLTGTGKSVVTQLVAGQRDQLEAIKIGTAVHIDDVCGAVGNYSTASHTLMPELTVESERSVAFYDCPGFVDTRSISVEIAISHFLKKLVDNVSRVKFVIVTTLDAFSGSDRQKATDLFGHVIKFIKDINKFMEGISIVMNFASRDLIEDDVLERAAQYMHETLKAGLESDWATRPDDLEQGLNLIDVLTARDGNDKLVRMGLLRGVRHAGYLDKMPLFQCLKENLKDIFFNRSTYIDTDTDDFGHALSEKAELHVSNIVGDLTGRIISNIADIAIEIRSSVYTSLQNYFTSSDAAKEQLGEQLRTAKAITYSVCKGENPEPHDCYIELIESVQSVYNGPLEKLQYAERYVNFTVFLRIASKNPHIINGTSWAHPLEVCWDDILKDVERIFVPLLNIEVTNLLSTFFNSELDAFQKDLASISSLSERKTKISNAQVDLTEMRRRIDTLYIDPASLMSEFISKIGSEFCTFNNNCDATDLFAILPSVQLVEDLLTRSWRGTTDWMEGFTQLTASIEMERKWLSEILQDLFMELSESKFQVEGGHSNLRQFWNQQPKVTVSNFAAFWESAESTISLGSKPSGEYFELVNRDTTKLDDLNELLTTTIETKTCIFNGSKSGIVANYISVADLSSCLTDKTEVVITAFHTFFMNLDLIARRQGGTNVLIVAPNIVVQGVPKLNLTGHDGPSHEPQSGTAGEVGKPGYPGYLGGNALVVAQKIEKFISPDLKGGTGGDGQDGAKGAAGGQGNTFYFTIQDKEDSEIIQSECEAYAGGKIQVKVQPHWCTPEEPNEPGRCHADNYATYYMYGGRGEKGKVGGNGGVGGYGGNGGEYIEVTGDPLFHRPMPAVNGGIGKNGDGGKGGDAGRNGSTTKYYIDDRSAGNQETTFSRIVRLFSSPVDKSG